MLDGGGGSGDGAPRSDAASDAFDAQPDASPAPCVDGDLDGFMVVNLEGSECGQVLDCDDAEPNAFPGQSIFFDLPRASGGFDYDCNGSEEKFDTEAGGTCQTDWWTCTGTGWDQGVPACGELGNWHRCEDSGGCNETESMTIRMPCR